MSSLLSRLAELGVQPAAVTADSRCVVPGSLFLAYPGERADGRRYIAQALQQGAVAVFWESSAFVWDAAWAVSNIPVSGLREEAGRIADAFYGHPSDTLWSIGITGTNGKT